MLESVSMMLPRRSPRLESPPPNRPAKPRQPKRVQDETEDSVRQAQYKTELAAWETANEEHAQLMKRRQAKQTAAWKTAQKGPTKIAPPASAQKGPAKIAPPAAAAPLSAEELRLVSSPQRGAARWVPVRRRSQAGRAAEAPHDQQTRRSKPFNGSM